MKHPDINLPKITNAVIKCNKIVIQTMMFIKLFLLDHYDKHNNLPIINDEFINSCMKILCNEKASGRPPKKEIKELKDSLTAFYKTDFQLLIQNENLDYTHMNTILDYLTIDILTMYENNIKLHYESIKLTNFCPFCVLYYLKIITSPLLASLPPCPYSPIETIFI